jgi:hypothetical protein
MNLLQKKKEEGQKYGQKGLFVTPSAGSPPYPSKMPTEEKGQERIISGQFSTHLSSISSYFVPKGGPHRSGVPQHGLNGQQWSARIDWTFGLVDIHGLLDPSFKETSQVPRDELVISQMVLRNPKEEMLVKG